MRRSVYYF